MKKNKLEVTGETRRDLSADWLEPAKGADSAVIYPGGLPSRPPLGA